MKVRITKLEELTDALNPNNIPSGFTETFDVRESNFEPPQLNKRFWVGRFSTSGVQEILDPNTFKTFNSIYRWEIIDENN